MFDLYLIARASEIHWKPILEGLRAKASCKTEDLEFRLREFPLGLLDTLDSDAPEFLEDLKREYPQLVEDIVSEGPDTLFRTE